MDHQCNCDEDRQEWLSKHIVNCVVDQAREKQLQFAHCYLKEKSTNTGTVRVAIVHGIEKKCSFVLNNNDYGDEKDYVCHLRPRILPSEHKETYQYISPNGNVTYPVIGGMTQTVNLPCSGTSKSTISDIVFGHLLTRSSPRHQLSSH